ncbi:MAG: hypothetical protein ACRD29_04680 [Acidimicrobiales bacterium]
MRQRTYGDTESSVPLGIAPLVPGVVNLVDYAAVQAGERVLVLFELDVDPVVVQAITAEVVRRDAVPAVLGIMPLPPGGAGDPSLEPVVAAWRASDVVISCVWWAELHTAPLFFTEITGFKARLVALHQAATQGVFTTGARFPPELFYTVKQAVLDRVVDAEEIVVRTPLGTGLSFRGLRFDTDNGPIATPGSWSPFPYGGANWYPEDTSGVAMVEESTVTGVPRGLLQLHFDGNRVVRIEGPEALDLEVYSPSGYYMRHAFIGLNPKVRWHEAPQFEREKRAGAFYFGIDALEAEDRAGPGHAHCDCQFDVCSIDVDGEPLVEDGRLLVLDLPEVRSAASRFGDPDRVLLTNPRIW